MRVLTSRDRMMTSRDRVIISRARLEKPVYGEIVYDGISRVVGELPQHPVPIQSGIEGVSMWG